MDAYILITLLSYEFNRFVKVKLKVAAVFKEKFAYNPLHFYICKKSITSCINVLRTNLI